MSPACWMSLPLIPMLKIVFGRGRSIHGSTAQAEGLHYQNPSAFHPSGLALGRVRNPLPSFGLPIDSSRVLIGGASRREGWEYVINKRY